MLPQGVLVQLRTDDAKPSRDRCGALADADLSRNIVKVQPAARRIANDALCAKNLAETSLIQFSQHYGQRFHIKGVRRFGAPA